MSVLSRPKARALSPPCGQSREIHLKVKSSIVEDYVRRFEVTQALTKGGVTLMNFIYLCLNMEMLNDQVSDWKLNGLHVI